MEWMTTKDAAEQWSLTMRRVQALCEADKVNGAVFLGRMWVIPKGTAKPIDGRTKEAKEQANMATARLANEGE